MLLTLALDSIAPPARATWSIVAVDRETREVGVAGASCIGGVEMIGGVVPGKGAVVAQALTNPRGRDAAMQLLAADVSPAEIVARIASARFDPGFVGWRWRQYGIVSLEPDAEPAVFTGPWVFAWSGGAIAPDVAVQGNLLRGEEVVRDSLAAFRSSVGPCSDSLADRLMRALEAGAAAGGDRRCAAALAALSAFLIVARPEDPLGAPSFAVIAGDPEGVDASVFTFLKRLVVPRDGTVDESPVRQLRAAFDERRRREGPVSGCPAEPEASQATP